MLCCFIKVSTCCVCTIVLVKYWSSSHPILPNSITTTTYNNPDTPYTTTLLPPHTQTASSPPHTHKPYHSALLSLLEHAFDGKSMAITLASMADLGSTRDDLDRSNTLSTRIPADMLVASAKYVLDNIQRVGFHFLARIYYSWARLSLSLPVEDSTRILQQVGSEMQARLDEEALTPANQLLFVKEVVAGTVLYYGYDKVGGIDWEESALHACMLLCYTCFCTNTRRKPELLVQLFPLVQPITALLRDPNVLQSETLPVQGLADALDACSTYDGLVAAHHETTQETTQPPTLLPPMVMERLQVILHNSRIVEGFLDDLSSTDGEEEGETSSQEDEEGAPGDSEEASVDPATEREDPATGGEDPATGGENMAEPAEKTAG